MLLLHLVQRSGWFLCTVDALAILSDLIWNGCDETGANWHKALFIVAASETSVLEIVNEDRYKWIKEGDRKDHKHQSSAEGHRDHFVCTAGDSVQSVWECVLTYRNQTAV